MNKNEIVIGRVDAVGFNGEGILHIDGATVFVPFSYVGEDIAFKVLKVKGSVAYGKVERIISPSISRLTPVCPVFGKCGGCQLQHLKYDEQVELKAQTVKDCFKKIAGIDIAIDKKYRSPNEYGYRNKLQLPLRSIKGVNKIGFFRENSHDVVETDVCRIQSEKAKVVINAVKNYVSSCGVILYDEESGKGVLRHVVVRETEGGTLITVVANADNLPYAEDLIGRFKTIFNDFSLYLNVNKRNTNVITGEKYVLLYGKGYAELNEFGVGYRLYPQAFYQVNTAVKTEIYSDVLDMISEEDKPVVIDAYAGAGVLTAMMAKRAEKAIGVEIVHEACESAKELIKQNGIENMSFIEGDCEKVLPCLIEEVASGGDRSVVVFDPPRKGVDIDTLLAAKKALPDKIIYISCSPQTLARDVGVLVGSLRYENGQIVRAGETSSSDYAISSVGVYDMFAQTKHVECVVSLSGK